MNSYKIITQKKWFSNNESVEDEFGNRKLEIEHIFCDQIIYDGDIIDLTEENKNYLDNNNIKYENDKFYGPLKTIIFKNNNIVVHESDVFGDPYWKLYKISIDGDILIGEHRCGYNIKQYRDELKNNTMK